MNISPNLREGAMVEFLHRCGWGSATRHPLPGDASTRRYIRLVNGERTAMLMDQPQHAEAPTASPTATPEERRALGYNAVARLAGADCARFVAAAKYLRRAGLAAPEVYDGDPAQGFLLLEDLGDDLYADVLAADGDEHSMYGAAIDALTALHASSAPTHLASDKPLFLYDETALLAETDLLTEWFLPAALGRPCREGEREEHRALWRDALKPVHAKPRVFTHRDYHAQNLMWLPARQGVARVGMVDFQDAVAGAPAYDLISLLEDARRDVSPALAEAMTLRYVASMSAADAEDFRATAALLAAQRNAKIIGIFARLSARDKKPRYLAFLPRVWRYMERDVQHPSLRPLKNWYDRTIPKDARGAPRQQGNS
jgi:aminoglycoside/choline kinase family phosphotransferase